MSYYVWSMWCIRIPMHCVLLRFFLYFIKFSPLPPFSCPTNNAPLINFLLTSDAEILMISTD